MSTDSAPAFDLAVCIGRYQVFHHAHLALLRNALALAPRCLVVIGSAYQSRSPRNPLSYQERTALIGLALTEEERTRVAFVPLRDYYDEQRWTAEVRKAAAATAPQGSRIVLVGHRKDPTKAYLEAFSGWTLHDGGLVGEVHAKPLREAFLSGNDPEAALAAIAAQVPQSTVNFLRAWSRLPHDAALREELDMLQKEKALWASAPYPPVLVTVDAVIRAGDNVLLIRRGRHPGRGLLALPGGFLEQRETVYQSALRELQEETGLRLLPQDMAHALKAVRVFDHPDRSQRGRVITHAHYFDLGDRRLPDVAGGDDAAEARWVPIATLTQLEDQFHDDHFHVLDSFLQLT